MAAGFVVMGKQTVLSILVAAKKLILSPDRWIKGTNARDAQGRSVWPDDPAATCFCMNGALAHVAGDDYAKKSKARSALKEATNVDAIFEFNDALGTTHSDVLAAFDRAIKNLRKRP